MKAPEAHTQLSDKPCPHCKAKGSVKYFLVGGMRDIGKSEVWGSKDTEEVKMKMKCTDCGKEWVEAL